MATKKEKAAAIKRALKKPSVTGWLYVGGVLIPVVEATQKGSVQAGIDHLKWRYFGMASNVKFLSQQNLENLLSTYALPAVPAVSKKIINKVAGNVISNALRGMPVRS